MHLERRVTLLYTLETLLESLEAHLERLVTRLETREAYEKRIESLETHL